MTKQLTTVASLLALALSSAAAAAPALADECPNAALRQGLSRALPDCRAYELVTTDSNHVTLGAAPSGRLSTDESRFGYQTIDAPDQASSASPFNVVVATRDASSGWSGASLAPPLKAPVGAFNAAYTFGVSLDLTSVYVTTDQPLTAETPTGINIFVGSPERGYHLLTTAGGPFLPGVNVYNSGTAMHWANDDFSRVIFSPPVAQLPGDPPSPYFWSQETGLRLIGILPDGTPAPEGADVARGLLQTASKDGRYVLFVTPSGVLYLRRDNSSTVELGQMSPNLGSPLLGDAAGISADGSTVIFTSSAELTADANTGPSHEGRDIYRYDTASGHLTDLTADTNAADVAGAHVGNVIGATPDGSHVYFTAAGNLAAGHTPGHLSMYVWHEGRIDFVANADQFDLRTGGFYVAPSGRHALLASPERLTSYDNVDPVTGVPHVEEYEATLGAGIVCVSCRVDGTPPTADTTVPHYMGVSMGQMRLMSDDGGRVFFQTSDAVVPQATSGLQHVFEYSNGTVSPLSPLGASTAATFLDASASGDDAFIATQDELVPNPNGGDQAVFDVRVDGGFPLVSREACSGDGCQAAATAALVLPVAASIDLTGHEALASARPAAARITVAKVRVIAGAGALLRVKVSGRGRLRLVGAGVQTRRSTTSKAQTVTVRVLLTSGARRTLEKRRAFKTTARLTFLDSSGKSSTVMLPLTFTMSSRKGR